MCFAGSVFLSPSAAHIYPFVTNDLTYVLWCELNDLVVHPMSTFSHHEIHTKHTFLFIYTLFWLFVRCPSSLLWYWFMGFFSSSLFWVIELVFLDFWSHAENLWPVRDAQAIGEIERSKKNENGAYLNIRHSCVEQECIACISHGETSVRIIYIYISCKRVCDGFSEFGRRPHDILLCVAYVGSSKRIHSLTA